MDTVHFTPGMSLLGGVLIGLSAVAVLALQGQIAGISGICGSLLGARRQDWQWRAGFLAGLLVAGVVAAKWLPSLLTPAGTPTLGWLALAGALVGFGTRLGNGCTSGHGVCGISRLSKRSIVATATFMLMGGLTVLAVRLLGAGGL